VESNGWIAFFFENEMAFGRFRAIYDINVSGFPQECHLTLGTRQFTHHSIERLPSMRSFDKYRSPWVFHLFRSSRIQSTL
jgi:hypothetical protein